MSKMKRFQEKEVARKTKNVESALHTGLNVAAYACMIHFAGNGKSSQRDWVSEAILEEAERQGLGKDQKLTASVFQGMRRWLSETSEVGQSGGNLSNLKKLDEARTIYFEAAQPKSKAKAKATAETPFVVEVKA